MEPVQQKILITVHGIRTFGQWQQRLANLLRSRSSVQAESYRYGYFSVLAFLLPPFRWLATLRFRRELMRICKRYPNARVHIVAHSFGTHLVGWGLRGIPANQRPTIHTVLLAGSVLRSDFPWAELMEDGRIRRVVNDCGIDDSVLLLSQFCVLLTGMAGRVGFIGASNERFTNRFFKGGHSHYFEQDEFMETHWVPLLLSNELSVPEIDQRATAGLLQGLALTAMQLAEPTKLAFYVGMPILLIFLFHIQPLAQARAQVLIESNRREQATLLAAAEKGKSDALEKARRSLADKLKAEERARLAEADKARAQAEKANAENESYEWMLKFGQRQQLLMSEAFERQVKLIGLLPLDQRQNAFNESLKLLDNTLNIEFDRSVISSEHQKKSLDKILDAFRSLNLKGNFIIYGYVGKFCLDASKRDETELASDSTPISSCDFGMSAEYALALGQRTSEAVGKYFMAMGIPPGRIETISEGKEKEEQGVPYPKTGYAKSWNLAASQNNHVRIRIR